MRQRRTLPFGPALLVVVLLAAGAMLGSWRRTVVLPEDGLSGQLLLGDRLMLAGQFCEPAPAPLRAALLRWAAVRETDPARLALLQGEAVSDLAVRSLSPGYRALALYQRTPSPALQQQLATMGSHALQRLNRCLLLLGGLLLVTLASLLLADRDLSEDRDSCSRPPGPLLVLGVYLAWDCWNLFAVGPAASSLAPELTGFWRLFLISGLDYLAMLALLLAAGRTLGGWRPPIAWSAGWIGPGFIACLLGVSLANLVTTRLLGAQAPLNSLVSYLLFGASSTEMLAVVLLACLVAPFFEELMFRGWLLAGLLPWLGSRNSLLVSALAFALVHGDVSNFLGLSVLGWILGWVYLRSGSLWAPIAVHAMWNAWGMVEIYANQA